MSTDKSQFADLSGTLWSKPTPQKFSPSSSDLVGGEVPEPLPETIGKYKVLGLVGSGAMGVVYKCSQPGLERPVAVKVMVAGRHASSEQIVRFQREAWAAAQLAHPGVLQIYDIGSEGERNYFVMEYVDGWPLDQLIGSPVLTLERTLRLLYQIARALEAAHAQGIIHRDIKPSNILIHRSGQPKLADFGLAKSLGSGQNLSGSGELIGTPRYMSPEQALAAPEEIDARTDIYSLGAVMYEILTGRPPVDGANVLTILRKLTDEEPIPIRELNPAVPEEVVAICQRAMAKDREARFATAGEFAGAIEGYLERRALTDGHGTESAPSSSTHWPTAWRGSPGRWLALGGVALLAIVLLAFYSRFGAPGNSQEGTPGRTVDSESSSRETGSLPAPAEGLTKRGSEQKALESDRSAQQLAQAREQLSGALTLARSTTPRERWRSILEKLTAVVHSHPEMDEAYVLRGQAHRRVGEYLAAIEDMSRFLQHQRQNLAAVTERMLANYQLHILYLGNLNEPILRPIRLERVRDDCRALEKGAPTQKYLAKLVQALAQQDYSLAGRLAETGPSANVRPEDVPDVSMLEADALFHVAESAYAATMAAPEGTEKEQKRDRHERIVHQAHAALRRGLDADPNHAGLLFLKADTFQRLAAWETTENEERGAMMRRQRDLFETTLNRLRNATLLGGCDNALARAVLLSNYGRQSEALGWVNDALSFRPTLPYLHTMKAWLRLQYPPDGTSTPEEMDSIFRELQSLWETQVDDYNSWFIRALVQAAAGRWDEAQKDLIWCGKKLKEKELPTAEPIYKEWYNRRTGPSTKYLDYTQEVLWNLLVVVDLRIRLAEDVLKRLADTKTLEQEGIKPDEIKNIKGLTHQRLAKAFAGKEDKAGVLNHIRQALSLRLPALKPSTFRDDTTFSAWNDQEEFKKLYKEFEGG